MSSVCLGVAAQKTRRFALDNELVQLLERTGRVQMWKIVLIATAFNLLFEYSMRGINNLRVQPFLPLVLFATYFTLFTMLEDLIVKYRLKDYHLVVAAFSYGIVYQCFVSGAAFIPPLIFGINLSGVLFVILVWWGAIQNVMTFYLANRLAPRDWNHQRLSKIGWATMLLLNGFMILIFQLFGGVPRGSLRGMVLMTLILAGGVIAFWKILPSKKERSLTPEFRYGKLMDYLSVLTVVIFVVCAVFLIFDPTKHGASRVNWTSTRIVVGWTIVLAVMMLSYRLHSGKPISV